MTKFMTLTAAAALLTGAVATAGTMDAEKPTEAEQDAVMQTEASVDFDTMSEAELNAWQLNELVRKSGAEVDIDYASTTAPVVFKDEPVKSYTVEETGTTLAETTYEDIDAMGGPEYASEKDASGAYNVTATVVDAANNDARFSTLVSLLQQTGLSADLEQDGPFTVFAPTNAAFEKLDADMRADLMADTPEARDELREILKAHVVPGTYTAASFTQSETTLDTLGETELIVEREDDGNVTAGDVRITNPDISVANGVIHVIDDVIVPEEEAILPGSVSNIQ